VTELAEAGIPVTVTCRVLKLSRQPYYRWLADPITDSEVSVTQRVEAPNQLAGAVPRDSDLVKLHASIAAPAVDDRHASR